jgi:hypothetical protein
MSKAFPFRRMALLWRWAVCLAVLALAPGLYWVGPAAASVNLPLHHWAYEAIERLTSLGIIDRAMVTTKPYSRKEAARYVARAIERARKDQLPADGREAVAEPLLERLMRELRPELQELDAVARPSGSELRAIRYGGRLTTEVDGFFVGGGQTVRFRENRGGEYYVNGAVNQTDVRGWMELGDWVSVTFQPKFISNRHVLGIGATNNSQNFYIREGAVKISHYNLALEIGRGTQWWGQGYHGSLLLTDHAYPLDMIKFGTEQPFKIPWLESLGDWKINSFLSRFEVNRDFPRAKLFGLRVTYQPTDWLELGATRLTQFGGRNSPSQQFPNAIWCNYSQTQGQNQGGKCQTNEQGMLDVLVRVPRVPYLLPFPAGAQLYGEFGLEDRVDHPAALMGIYIPQVFKGDSLDFRFEFADTDLERQLAGNTNIWYNNGTYTSGMRYKGFPLGHHMGTDGLDFFMRTTERLTDKLTVGANLNYQERARSLPVFEKKREASVDMTLFINDRTQFTLSYVYQRIENPGQITSIVPFAETFASGVTAYNNFVWTTLSIEF